MANIKPWYIYKNPDKTKDNLPKPPHWRKFPGQAPDTERPLPKDNETERRFKIGTNFLADQHVVETVNTALYLRRPILVTGKPGIGKSSLAYSIALDLDLGKVLRWPITSRSTIKDGLYTYDAIGRLQEANLLKDQDEKPEIGSFITLGPLGTALLPTKYPRVLLIDEIDKSDVDLPNDLLNMFEEGEFEIPELVRLKEKEVAVRPYDAKDRSDTVTIQQGLIQCAHFPIVILASNRERDLPPAFLRRCLQLEMQQPSSAQLEQIVKAHFIEESEQETLANIQVIIDIFVKRRSNETLATDQLLNAVFLVKQGKGIDILNESHPELLNTVFKSLRS